MPQKSFPDNKDFVPICQNIFFSKVRTDSYVQVSMSPSFSKSKNQKLKLIKESKSQQKVTKTFQQKRKIKPLKVKIDSNRARQVSVNILCSIKDFKSKVKKVTEQSVLKNRKQTTLAHADNYHHAKINAKRETLLQGLQNELVQIAHTSNFSKQKNAQDLIPTLANSFVVNEGVFNPKSFLLSNQNTISSLEASNYKSSISILEYQNQPINFRKTENSKQSSKQTKVSKQRISKKQHLTLNMARQVQTCETLKTQNEGSLTESRDYSKNLEILVFPNYFSLERLRKLQNQKLQFNKSQTNEGDQD